MSGKKAAGTIGIDWGGTSIKGAVVEEGRVTDRASRDTRAGSPPAEILDAIADLVGELSADPGPVGVAIPGEVDEAGRCWRLPNVPGFAGVAIAAELEGRLDAPVRVENDATAAALGERLFGWGEEYGSFLLITLGTGTGGGLVLDGRVRRGRHGFAGEIGHVLVDSSPEAWPCGCGKRGCLEAYAGSAGLLRRFRERGGEAEEVGEIAAAGEELAGPVWEMLGEALGTALATLNNTLDLEAVVLGGGISNALDRFEPHLRRALEARAFAPPLAEIPLLASRLREDAGVVGAAQLTASMGAGERG